MEKNISVQLVMQNYMLERLLERISLSKYKHNFILKGGFLISAIVGLDTRTTMDLDTTVKGFTLTHESIREIFEEICAVEIADDVKFEIKCWKCTRTLSPKSVPANSSRTFGKSISVILTMQKMFPLTRYAILFSSLWTASHSK